MESDVSFGDILPDRVGQSIKRAHQYAYNVKRIQRFLLHTLAAFFLQYLVVIHLPHTFPALPMYPPIGTALILFYFLGVNAIYGLFLGGFCAYLFTGWPMLPLLLYLTADIGCGYLGARLCRSVFSSDQSVMTSTREWVEFIKKNALTTCVLSSLIRLVAIIVSNTISMPFNTSFYGWMDLWLADLNSILVVSSFFLSWISVYLKREKIAHGVLKKQNLMVLLFCILIGMVFLKKIELMIVLMAVSIYLSYRYGFLLASALTYLLTLLCLIGFIFYQQQSLEYLGIQKYTIIPVTVMLFTMVMLYLGQITSRHYYQHNSPATLS